MLRQKLRPYYLAQQVPHKQHWQYSFRMQKQWWIPQSLRLANLVRMELHAPVMTPIISQSLCTRYHELKKIHPGISWRDFYIQQFLENRIRIKTSPTTPPPKQPNPSSSGKLMGLFRQTFSLADPTADMNDAAIPKILMFGEGGAVHKGSVAKMLTYSMMSPGSPFQMSGRFFSGSKGIGSGVGFEIAKKSINLITLHFGKYLGKDSDGDVLNDKVISNEWRAFLQQGAGFIFVLESDDRDLDGVYLRVKKFLALIDENVGNDNDKTEEQGDADKMRASVGSTTHNATARQILPPILVVIAADSLDPDSASTLGVAALAEKLIRGQMKQRNWCIRAVEKDTLTGLMEGFHWLTDNM
eukprot:TRINITY_DN6178_c0_g1_i1.p1 TRINITY_DN6178_c0_g1~~TRINITY_DN6178_c0_g1_i1.p1  ORF type:complete len:356 (+),score=70.07 TRINITY_DN6178_c0_g1_i1:231-1298(+)